MKDWKFHCAVLGVRENASAKDVRRAYRKLALERHPDKHNNSTRSKEDFQQLNESYRFLLDAIADGLRTPPRAAPEPKVDQEAPTNPSFRPPVRRNAAPPAPVSRPGAGVPKKVWLHGAAICFTLLTASLWIEMQRERAPASRHAKHFPTTYEGPATPSPAPASVPNPLDAIARQAGEEPKRDGKSCHISLERAEGLVQDFPSDTESKCHVICDQLKENFSKAGLVCNWGGTSFFERALFHPPIDDGSPPRFAKDPMPGYVPPADAQGGFETTCMMTILEPGNPTTPQFPNDTLERCSTRCQQAMISNPHAEVQCYFAGRVVGMHRPDPLRVYLAEHPEELKRLQGMNSTSLATCKIVAATNGKSVTVASDTMEWMECDVLCKHHQKTVPAGTTVGCYFDNRPVPGAPTTQ